MTCTKCYRSKSPSEFSPSARHRNGLFPWCKPCKAAYQLNRINGVPKEIRDAQQAAWRAARNADKDARAKFLRNCSFYSLRRRYGITEHQVVELFRHQRGVCAICGEPPDTTRKRGGLHIDHDHTTGVVRGLVCESCNLGLGFFKDSPKRLVGAISYLRNPPTNTVTYTEPVGKPSVDKGERNPEKRALLNLVCIQCGLTFIRKTSAEHASRARGKEGPFCGAHCVGVWRQKKQNPVGLVHGTTNGYTYYKCRCSECKKAHTLAERNRKKRLQ